MMSTMVRRVGCALCEEWELVAPPETEERLLKRGWLRLRGEWWCRVCSSLARASQLAARALERTS